MKGVGGRGGIDISLTKNDNLSFGFRYGNRDMSRGSELSYLEWSNLDSIQYPYSSDNMSDRSGDFYAINSDFKHTFSQKNHELTAQLILSYRDMDEEQSFSLFDDELVKSSGTIQFEEGPSYQIRMKLDYTRPLKNKAKIETGYQSRLGKAEDNNKQSEYNPLTGLYDILSEYNRSTEYSRNIHSIYFMYSNEVGKFGFKSGIRGEYTYRNIFSREDDESFKIDRWDYFPTLHLSYRFKEEQQMMASYSRRIRRSRGWYMEPFLSWSDPFNVRIGNPNLKPQFINSFELGFQQFLGRNLLSAEAYYRITENKVEFIRSVYAENVTLRSVENVGKDYAIGSEFMINFSQWNFLNINMMLNLYNYRVEGELNGIDFSSEDFSWNTRINTSIKITDVTRFQISNIYRSSSVTSQGEQDDTFISNFALKQELFSKMLSVTLQLNDAFSGSKRESISSGSNFYNYTLSERDSPTIMLNLSFNFNNYKPERKSDRNGTDYSEDDF